MSTRRRALVLVPAVVVLAIAAFVLGVGWHYASEIRDGALAVKDVPPMRDLMVTSLGDGTITLHTTEATDLRHGLWRRPGVWGISSADGYGRADEILQLGSDSVVRRFEPLTGKLAPGAGVSFDAAAFTGNPLRALGLPFTDVTFESELGPLRAWKIDGSANTWVIIVHGKGGNMEESMRVLPAFAEAGLPTLVIDYRNDRRMPRSLSGTYDYGESEWRDVDAAARYALNNGASGIVVMGFSMGGAIVMQFVTRSELADRVRAVILDSPVLDFGDTIDYGAERRNLGPAITWWGKTVAGWRFGFDWSARDILKKAGELRTPILLFHGDADHVVNVRTSDALARARPDLVTYVRVAGAAHAAAWNADPQRYESAVDEFLARVLNRAIASPAPFQRHSADLGGPVGRNRELR